MKSVLKIVSVIVLGVTLALLSFVGWASKPLLPREVYRDGEIVRAERGHGRAPFRPERPAGVYALVTWNIGYASGLTNNSAANATAEENEANLKRLAEVMQQTLPDIAALQEVDFESRRSYSQDQAAYLAEWALFEYRAVAYNWDTRYVPFPYWPPASHFGRVLSGQVVLADYRIAEQQVVAFPKPSERSSWYNAFYPDRLAQVVEVDMDGTPVTVINVHLEAYMRGSREQQAARVAELAARYNDGPLLVVGDFNAVPPWAEEPDVPESPETVRDGTIETLLKVGLEPAIPEGAYAAAPEQFHTFRSDNPRAAIDHIFYNRYIEPHSARVLQDAGTPSDHLPVLFEFRIQNQG